jgi:hypothetical protein
MLLKKPNSCIDRQQSQLKAADATPPAILQHAHQAKQQLPSL